MIVQHRRGLALCTTVALGALAFGSGASAAPIGWSQQFGSDSTDFIYGAATNSRGEVAVVGETLGQLTLDVPSGGWDGFIVKYDKSGNQKWILQFGSAGDDFAEGIAMLANGDVVIAGSTSGALGTSAGGYDLFAARYDKNGNRKWLTQFGTSQTEDFADLAVTSAGVVYIAGGTQGTFAPNATNTSGEDALVARLDAKGKLSWVRQLNGDGDDMATSVAVTSNETVRVGGYATSSSLLGHTNLGDRDAFLTTFDKKGVQGTTVWFATADADRVDDVTLTSTGEVRVAGTTNGQLGDSHPGGYDIFVARLTKTLQQTWIEQFGTAGQDTTRRIAVAKNGTSYVLATTNDSWPGASAAGGADILVLPVGAGGTQGQARLLGTSNNDSVGDLALRSSNANGGALVVAGTTPGSLFGFSNAGVVDGFVITFPI